MSLDYEKYKPEFHGTDASYVLPADDHEQQRLSDQHDAWKVLMDGKTFHAPVQNPKTIADIGCGPGITTRLLASKYPSAKIYGNDLRELPGHTERAENIEWVYGDTRQVVDGGDSRLSPGSIDYFYQRLLHMGMTDWPNYLQKVLRTVRSGGWIELQEWNWRILEGGKNVSEEWPWQQKMVRHAWEAKGLDLCCTEKLEGWMRDAGLIDVKATSYLAPLGQWYAQERPQSEVMGRYLEKWWPTVCWVCIESIMGNADPQRNQIWREQMVKDLELAFGQQRKAYEIVVVTGRKP